MCVTSAEQKPLFYVREETDNLTSEKFKHPAVFKSEQFSLLPNT
jgi:hypothetical protein